MKENIDELIALYQERLDLTTATFVRIDHDHAMVADVYQVTQSNGAQFILKICSRLEDYLREVYFLKKFVNLIPVPRIIQVVEPEGDVYGAILMEYLPGRLLEFTDFTETLAYEMGSILGLIHLQRTSGYGDLTRPDEFKSNPRHYFTLKFEEGLSECSHHLPKVLMEQSRHYYEAHIHLLDAVDGPCVIHRDFRPGNVIVDKGAIRGIIDWSSGRASFSEDDFCPMEHGEWPNHPTSKPSFLRGYESVRPLPNYERVMPLLRLSRALATIGFTVKRGTWAGSNARPYLFNRRFLEAFFKEDRRG